jgi:hypothetical protein
MKKAAYVHFLSGYSSWAGARTKVQIGTEIALELVSQKTLYLGKGHLTHRDTGGETHEQSDLIRRSTDEVTTF